MMSTRYPLEEYFQTLIEVDARGASELVLDLLDVGTPVHQIATRLLAPAQVRVGQMWERGLWSIADEHAATAVTETALHALGSAVLSKRSRLGRHLMVACAEGEWHSLPARLAATVATAGGARVTTLGASLPAEHLRRRLEKGDVDLLALSCSVPTNLIGAARCIAAAHEVGVPVLAGGRAFGDTPQRAYRVGADAWAADATALLGAIPDLAGRVSDVPTEALVLDATDEATIEVAYREVVTAFPRIAALSPLQQAKSREDLLWMARFTGAAVLTDDPSVIHDLLRWIVALLQGQVPPEVITVSARLLADTVGSETPVGASMLRDAAERVERQPEPS